jgi:hypothetical protein
MVLFFFTFNVVNDNLKNVNSTQGVLQERKLGVLGEQLAIQVEVKDFF